MKYAALLIACCSLLASIDSNAQAKKKPVAKKPAAHAKSTGGAVKYSRTADGLEYNFLKHGKGQVTAKLGDMIQIHVIQKIGDSVMMNSYKQNAGQPYTFILQASPAKGDVTQGLTMMKVGDSAIFRIRMDTLASRAKQPFPEFAGKNDYMSWTIKLDSIKDKKLVDAEMKLKQEEMVKKQEEAKKNAEAQKGIDDKLIQDYLASKGITNARKTATGLYYVITKEGSGPNAAAGQKVWVNYTGINMKGEKFDSSVDPDFHHVEPISFDLGTHGVIAGWDEGIALLNKGAKATLYIPSALAYGASARGEKIPANAILIFDVELVDMK